MSCRDSGAVDYLKRSPCMRRVGYVFESHQRQTQIFKILLNARQQVWVSQVLGDDHYKLMSRVTAGVAR